MKLETIRVADLHLAESQIRFHPETQIAAFMQSLQQFGQTRPVVIDERNVVLAGNGMVMSMQRMGWTQTIAYRITGLTESAKNKLMLSDNRIYELGTNVTDEIIATIRELGQDLDVPGYDSDLLAMLQAPPPVKQSGNGAKRHAAINACPRCGHEFI